MIIVIQIKQWFYICLVGFDTWWVSLKWLEFVGIQEADICGQVQYGVDWWLLSELSLLRIDALLANKNQKSSWGQLCCH